MTRLSVYGLDEIAKALHDLENVPESVYKNMLIAGAEVCKDNLKKSIKTAAYKTGGLYDSVVYGKPKTKSQAKRIMIYPKGKNDKVANAIKIDELISKTSIPYYGIWRYCDVTGANFFAAENGSTRATDPVKFLIKTTKLPTGKYLNQLCISSYSEILTMQFSLALVNAEVSNLKANSSLINFSENNFIVDSKN